MHSRCAPQIAGDSAATAAAARIACRSPDHLTLSTPLPLIPPTSLQHPSALRDAAAAFRRMDCEKHHCCYCNCYNYYCGPYTLSTPSYCHPTLLLTCDTFPSSLLLLLSLSAAQLRGYQSMLQRINFDHDPDRRLRNHYHRRQLPSASDDAVLHAAAALLGEEYTYSAIGGGGEDGGG